MNWLRQKRKVEALEQQLVRRTATHRTLDKRLEQSASRAFGGPGARIWAFNLGLTYGLARKPGSSAAAGLGAVTSFVRSSLFFMSLAGPRL